MGIAAILIWSASVAFTRGVTRSIGPVTAAGLTYLLGGAMGLAWMASRRRLAGLASLNRKYLLGCGALFILYIACFYLAVGLAANESQTLELGLLNYLWPMATVLFSIPLLGTKAHWAVVPGALLGFAGIVLAVTQERPLTLEGFAGNVSSNPAAYLLALGAGVSWGLYSNLVRRWGGPKAGGAVPLFMLATAAIFGLARPFVLEPSDWSLRPILELLFLSIGPNLGYFLWDAAMRRGDILLVATCSYFTPLLSTLVTCLYLGATARPKLWTGCVLVIAGAVICKRSVREPGA